MLAAAITEYGEIVSGNLTDVGEIVSSGITETGAFAFDVVVALLKEVFDSLLVADNVLRHKSSMFVADNISAIDLLLNDKALHVSDLVGLVDGAFTPSRVLLALDSVGVLDGALVHKALLINDNVSLIEVVWAGQRKESVLYLVLGNLIVNLKTGKVEFGF